MNLKKSTLVLTICLTLLCPFLSSVLAYRNVEKMSELRSSFFLVNLKQGDYLEVKVEALENGIFGLFLFDKRPEETNVNFDGTLEDELFTTSIQYSMGENPTLRFTAQEPKIYYIQLILVENGPDTYILTSNLELTRYYLPQLQSYPIEILIISTFFITSILVLLTRKKIKN